MAKGHIHRFHEHCPGFTLGFVWGNKNGLEAICSKSLFLIEFAHVFDLRKQAPPVGLEEAVDLLEKTLSDAVGGNISCEDRDLIRTWADLYRRANSLCEELGK